MFSPAICIYFDRHTYWLEVAPDIFGDPTEVELWGCPVSANGTLDDRKQFLVESEETTPCCARLIPTPFAKTLRDALLDLAETREAV